MNLLQDLSAIAPLWITALAGIVVLLLTVSGGFSKSAISSGTHLAIICLVALATSALILSQFSESQAVFSGAILVDGLGVLFGLTTVVGAFIGIIFAVAYLHEHKLSSGEYFSLILFSTVGMLIVSMAGDMITLFIGIETMSLAIYVLAGYRRNSVFSQEAALKYFIYGAFASAFALFGIALIYGEVGRILGAPALSYSTIAEAFATQKTTALSWTAVAMVLGGLAFKIAAVPFHMWAPDVYEGAPTPSTGFMAVAVKTAAFAGLCRFVAATVLNGKRGTETAIQIFEVLGILTMIVGNLLAIRQTQIKRMLAYSSVAHAGYLLVGIAAFMADPEGFSISAIAYYLFGYTVMTLGAFGVVLAFERRNDRRANISLERLAGIAHRYPALGLAMAVFMFSLAGIPPSAGFFGKLAIFSAAIEANRIGIVIVAVLASAAGAYYYLRVTVIMYMRAADTVEERIKSPWLAAGLWICVLVTLGIGILPEFYFAFAKRILMGWLG